MADNDYSWGGQQLVGSHFLRWGKGHEAEGSDFSIYVILHTYYNKLNMHKMYNVDDG